MQRVLLEDDFENYDSAQGFSIQPASKKDKEMFNV
jgi:hypothetical protein